MEGPMQKIIPMNPDKGVYMIIYSDNRDADFFKKYFSNTRCNREALNRIFETSLCVEGKLHIESIKEFYWKKGRIIINRLRPNLKTGRNLYELRSTPARTFLLWVK